MIKFIEYDTVGVLAQTCLSRKTASHNGWQFQKVKKRMGVVLSQNSLLRKAKYTLYMLCSAHVYSVNEITLLLEGNACNACYFNL